MLTCLVPVLLTFYIQGVLKLKKIIPAPKVKHGDKCKLYTRQSEEFVCSGLWWHFVFGCLLLRHL